VLKISSYKLAQGNFLEDFDQGIDFGEDVPEEEIPGFINEKNYERYLPEEADKTPDEEREYIRDVYTPQEELAEEPVLPAGKEHMYEDTMRLVYDGIDHSEVISFDYTDRFGNFLGTRTVQPHYTFDAITTGNEILVTWDLDRNDIRAFILGNIHPGGIRYEGSTFELKPAIMQGVSL